MTVQEEQEQEARKEEDNKNKTKKRKMGLALVDSEKVRHIAKKGGLAPHSLRGLQAASAQTRHRVSSLGGRIRAMDTESMNRARAQGKKVLREKYGADFYSVILNNGGKGKGSKVFEEHYSVEIYDDDDGSGKKNKKKGKK